MIWGSTWVPSGIALPGLRRGKRQEGKDLMNKSAVEAEVFRRGPGARESPCMSMDCVHIPEHPHMCVWCWEGTRPDPRDVPRCMEENRLSALHPK
jgi:hypothetical protein